MKGKYGEPWGLSDRWGQWMPVDNNTGHPISGKSDCDRAVACVNALDGLNPEAVGELIEAARVVCDNKFAVESNPPESYRRLLSSIANVHK
jgi:hypothetical protein